MGIHGMGNIHQVSASDVGAPTKSGQASKVPSDTRSEGTQKSSALKQREAKETGSILGKVLSAIGFGKTETPRNVDDIRKSMQEKMEKMVSDNLKTQLSDQLGRLKGSPRLLEKFDNYLASANPADVARAISQNTLIGHLAVKSK